MAIKNIKSSPAKRVKDYLISNKGFDYILNRSRGLSKRVFNPPRDQYKEVHPGIYSDDPRHIEFLKRLFKYFDEHEEWHATWDEVTGLSTNHLTNDWQRILTVAGTKNYPVGIGQDDNSGLAKQLDIPVDWIEPGDIELFDELWQCLFAEGYTDAPFSLNSSSSTTIPHFAKDSETKMTITAKGIRYILSKMPLDPKTLIENDIFPIYYCVTRGQQDKTGKYSKPRQGWDGFNYVETSPRHGISGMNGMRTRTAFALSGTTAYPIIMAVTPMRKYTLNKYAFTYKHRGPEDMVKKLKGFKYAFGGDVTNFDFSPQQFLMERFVENFNRYEVMSERMTRWISLTMGAPSISASPYPASELQDWPAGLDPFKDESFALNKGLRSGNPFVSDFGRLACCFDILQRLDKLGYNIKGNVSDFLLGRHPQVILLNAGDDSLIATNDKDLPDRLFAQKGYFAFEKEETTQFLGTIFGLRDGEMVGYPNIWSYILKKFCPEHGLGKKVGDHRAFANLGFREAKTHYSKHPRFSELYAIVDKIHLDVFGLTQDAMMARRTDPEIPFAPRTFEDRQYLINPDAIHYKIDMEDVSPELLGLHRFSIPEEETLALARALYHENFLDKYIPLNEVKQRNRNVTN